jgi:hypothetical protein
MRNYRCCAEYTDRCDYAARKRELDEASKRKDTPPHLIAYYRESLEGSGKKYELQTIVGDSTGRIRITDTFGNHDLDDARHVTGQMDVSWDGTMNVNYMHSNPDKPGGAVITPDRSIHFVAARHPMWTFGGRFLAAMDKAIENGEKIDVDAGPDGLQQVRFACEDPMPSDGEHLKRTWTGTVDPSKGFSIHQWEYLLPNGERSRFSATFTEVSDGVWFPTEGRIEGYFADGMPKTQTSVKIVNVIVNDPNFDATLYHIDLPNGTHVVNRIAGVVYFVGDPTSMRAIGDSTNTAHIVNDTMENDGPSFESIIFIPHMRQAIEKDTSFVLDLRARRLVGVDKASNSQDVIDSLHGAGIGDVFWDGDIVVVGETKVNMAPGQRQFPLAFTGMDGGGRYRLPENIDPPCSLRITDRRGSQYNVVIKQIREEGISITCRLVSDR